MTFTQKLIEIRPLGDSALVVQLGKGIDPAIQQKVLAFLGMLEANPFSGFLEATPSFNSLTIFYDPVIIHPTNKNTIFETVKMIILNDINQLITHSKIKPRHIEIPVVYGGMNGPDLQYVADYHGLTTKQVIDIHSQQEYLVYMLGFAPGFPFLGGMDEQIATPRKESPRRTIPAGSVGIAGKQTGVYPLETPGGWQIIGRTSIDLFLPKQNPPTLLKAGDIIRFIPTKSEVSDR